MLAVLVIALPSYPPTTALGSVRDLRDVALPSRAADEYAVPRDVARLGTYPARWLAEARCIHYYETRGQHDPWHIQNGDYAGGFQFTLGTWNSAGRPYRSLHDVAAATPSEQMHRAYIVWHRHHTWRRDWPNTSRLCGTS